MAITPEQDAYLYLLESLRKGDLEGVRLALGDPADLADARESYTHGNVLAYASIESPLPFIRTLIELGADPNYHDLGGFPSLLNVLDGSRADKYELLELLLDGGADVHRRGVNGYTALHMAAAQNDARATALLLARGADPTLRTNVEDYETPLEIAEGGGCAEAIAALRAPR